MSHSFTAAPRTENIAPFHVMELVKRARVLEAAGRSIIHMSIGEPDFTAPQPVIDALTRAVQDGNTQYTPALGVTALRQEIAISYLARYGVAVPWERIMITAGASGALLLAMAATLTAGDEILMPDPSYPCNRHFVSAFDGVAKLIPCGPEQRFQLTAEKVDRNWGPKTRGVMIASPSNPTGTSIEFEELKKILAVVRKHGGFTIVDEIYLALCYEAQTHSALELLDESGANHDVIVINSFSKYFNMTGWRLGWLVAPAALMPVFEKLSQNLYICPSTPAQHAAMACFSPEALEIYEQRKGEFRRRRDYIVPALRELGFDVPVTPDGAFYVYVDCSRFLNARHPDSDALALHILENSGVGVVPGKDFGVHDPQRWLRMSYATSMENLQEAVRRMGKLLTV